ncbi:MAG TPA: DUF481 domain-containing protein [Gammaproteobacteria bacterium]|nr:DUF481 domain-containing protein [Gammaproteobacteria bacterium]
MTRKVNIASALAVAIVTSSQIAADPKPIDANISLFDYSEATSAFENAYSNFNLDVSKDRGDAQTKYTASLGIDAQRVLSSPNRDIDLRFVGNGQIKRDGVAGASSTNNYVMDSSITYDNYFQPDSKGGFWFGKLGIKADDSFNDLDTRLSVGLGYGRVTNVTPMAKAIRLVQELRYRGALAAAPSKDTYRRIADIISRENEYQSKYGGKPKFYQQYWIGDIEKVLGKTLSATGALAARDVLIDENISTRRYGWKVRAGLSYVGKDFSGLTDNPGVLLGAEYHRPLSNQTQFSNEAELVTTFDSTNSYTLNNTMSYVHEIEDRIDWINRWNLNYSHSAIDSDNVVTNTLSSILAYELGNSLDLALTALIKNTDGNRTVSAGEKSDGTDRSLNIGVRYRLR